jgi:septum formation protein
MNRGAPVLTPKDAPAGRTVGALILASQSPYRQKLLAATGLAFAVETAPIDEHAVGGATPREVALNRAAAKATAVAALRPGALVIGADQVLSFEGAAFDKVADATAAAARLARLAVGVVSDTARLVRHAAVTRGVLVH